MNTSITYIGTSNWRNTRQRFGIRDKDRLMHIYAIGKTGSGKSTLLSNMAISDIRNGNGLCVIDPHGDLVESLLEHVSQERISDVVYLNPADTEFPVAFNLLKDIHPKFHHIVTSGIISAFKKIWPDGWGPRTEHMIRFSVLSLLEYREGTILDIQRLLTDDSFRKQVLLKVRNPHVKRFWQKEYKAHSQASQAVMIAPILNKLGIFASSVPLRNMFDQKERSFNMLTLMDEGKILIVNLSKGKIGEDASTFIGSMVVSSIQLAALYRAHQPEHTRRPFFLYVDECHNFLSLSFADILSEARKYGLGVFMCNQYLEQLQSEIWSAIRGNVGTLISFRVGATDAQYLAREFYPTFNDYDIINLPRYSMYIKLMIDGTMSQPFSADSLPPPQALGNNSEEIIATSRKKYGRQQDI